MPAGVDVLARAQGFRRGDRPPAAYMQERLSSRPPSLLAGHVQHDAAQPLEILRTIHGFDPCIACAVHVAVPGGARLTVGMR